MVDFIRDAEITALITSDGAAAMGTGNGEAQKITQAMGGGLALVYDKENAQLYSGVGSVLAGSVLCLQYEYDFALHGGAVGEIVVDGPAIPPNFWILNGVAIVKDAVTSGGSATVSIGTKTGSVDNLLAATAKASLTDEAKFLLVPDFATVADSIVETAERLPIIAVATAALTAGRIKFALMGIVVS